MNPLILSQILKRYGITPTAIDRPQKGYRNSSYRVATKTAEYNLIIFKRERGVLDTIRTANTIGSWLSDSGFPARYPVDSRTIRIFNGETPMYAGLYNYLPGQTIPWESYTTKRLLALGTVLSDMHEALTRCNDLSDIPETHEVVDAQIARMKHYFQDTGVVSAAKAKLGVAVEVPMLTVMGELVSSLGASKNKQALHMDFVRGNILFNKQAEITGIIDFEKASKGHPVFDVARTLAFLIVDCRSKEAARTSHIFLNRGYGKRGAMNIPRITYDGSDHTLEVLDRLVTTFLAYDFYKFLRHNPYESLGKNEHYVRTRDQLLKRNVISKI